MDSAELRDLLDFAVESAQRAGRATLGYFNADPDVELKTDKSPVTIADRSAEEILRTGIERAYPDHGILGEEFGDKAGTTPARWILDPIDGTVSFVCGAPFYSVLVGLEWSGEMIVGVIHLPALGETVYAARGLGCYCNGRRARVSNVQDLAQARLSCTSVKLLYDHNRGGAYERLRDACYADRGWADAYGYAMLATGRADVVLDPVMSIWDTAALLPVVTEAGGTFTDWNGTTTHTAPEAVATNGHLFEPVMQRIRG